MLIEIVEAVKLVQVVIMGDFNYSITDWKKCLTGTRVGSEIFR